VSAVESPTVALAGYVLRLGDSLAQTHHANDRPIYQRLLADVAPTLALLIRGADAKEISSAIQRHERLSSELFLAGPEHSALSEAWRRFKEACGTITI
jgi:hypothetical protein